MVHVLKNETLSFYLSKSGFPKFRQWFKSIEQLELIYNELESLTNLVETSKWLDDNFRNELLNKIKLLILKHIEKTIGKEPEKCFDDWIDSIKPYCFQGGYGYRIKYSGNCPHHYCIYCDHYEKVKNIPNDVILCCIITDKYINISETPEQVIWYS